MANSWKVPSLSHWSPTPSLIVLSLDLVVSCVDLRISSLNAQSGSNLVSFICPSLSFVVLSSDWLLLVPLSSTCQFV